MSQKSYNLTDNVNDGFQFDLRGKVYFMKYPTMGEIEELQRLAEDAKAKSKSDESAAEQPGDAQDYMYQFISPVDHDTPIKYALKDENLKVLQNFNTMVRAEFSLEG